ncbi:MAG TPA: response regulator [Candidatus Saccharimonadales bacterium]|nr:response regulator [Candidatus Saccharimonadales bacterium]
MEKQLHKLVLIVDDQADDQAVLSYMLGRVGVVNPVFCLQDGHETLRYLNGEPPYSDRSRFPFPAALFLDLQMPVLSGWQVLDWIRGSGLKGNMRIFVYSHPSNVGEVQKLYKLGADSFLKKPAEEAELRNLVAHFPTPWILEVPFSSVAPGLASTGR